MIAVRIMFLLSSACWFLAICAYLVGMTCTNCLRQNLRNKRIFCLFASALSVISGVLAIGSFCFWMINYVFDFEKTHARLKTQTLVGTFGVWGSNYNPQKLEPLVYAGLIADLGFNYFGL